MIGILAFFGFPLYGWIWSVAYPQHYENFKLRYVGMVLAIPFIFAKKIRDKRRMQMYSYLAITYMAPFFFTFMFLMNNGSSVWSQSLLIGTVALFHFEALFATISWVIGSVLAYAVFLVATDYSGVLTPEILVNIPIDIFAVALVSITKVSRKIFEEEKLSGMSSVLGSISHELRTPLLSVHASAKGLKQYVPRLIEQYKATAESLPANARILPRHLEMTMPAIERITAEVQAMNTAIDLLMANVGRTRDKPHMVKIFSMSELVERTITWYPFESEKSRKLVSLVIKSDFKVEANEDLMAMVIANLLKNALRAIARARKGDIKILVEANQHGGLISIRDTGSGIPQSQLPHIFTRFHSYPAHEGTGIGLAFCRETLAIWKADIYCRSEENLFAEFVLTFKNRFQNDQG